MSATKDTKAPEPPQVSPQLASLAESLKGASLEDFIKSIAQQTMKESQPEKPIAPPTPVVPRANTPELLSELKSKEKTEPAALADYLALHAQNHIHREIRTCSSTFVPTMTKMYYVLNQMDSVLSDNYYARRGLPYFFPTLTRIYVAVLTHYQLLRVARYAREITPEAAQFLDVLETLYPPATLPVPGLILPFLQALCVSVPENPRFRKILPVHPTDYLQPDLTNANRYRQNAATNLRDWYLPFIPHLLQLHHNMMLPFNGPFSYGAHDSAGQGFKSVIREPQQGVTHIVDLLSQPSFTNRQVFFPFPTDQTTHQTANDDGDPPASHAQTNVFGNIDNNPLYDVHQDLRESLTKCGIAEPITVHHDLIQQIKANFPRLQIPNPGVNDFCNTWAHLFGMNADTQWFSELSAMMAGYCQFYPSCGTLADCAVEGPAVGQFIANTQLSTEPPPRATHFGQTTATRQFDTRLSTTTNSEATLTEKLAYYTQIHTRMAPGHLYLGQQGSEAHRNGPFWEIRPIHTAGTTDSNWIQIPHLVRSSIRTRANNPN